MPHKFDPAQQNKLDSPERLKRLPPREVLMELGLKIDDSMIDIGAGSGFFSLPAAEMVGPQGKITAVDISAPMLEVLQARAREKSLNNINTTRSDEYDLKTPAHSMDFALLSVVLHEVAEPARLLQAAHQVLKPGGRLAIIEWINKPMESGPPPHDRIGQAELMTLVESAMFKEIVGHEFNAFFYCITAVKK